MPKGTKDQKRPGVSTGEDFPASDGKDKAAQSLGRRGGLARANVLSQKRRVEIARRAAEVRWSGKK